LFWTADPKYFSQNRGVTGILDLKIDSVANVIEKGFETGVSVSFGGLFVSFSKVGQKRKNFIWGDRIQFPVTKFI